MKLVPILLALTATALVAQADAGAGSQTTTQTRTVPAFTRVDLRSPVRTDVHEGRAAHVAVQIDDALQQALLTHVEGDTLVVELQARGSFHIANDAVVSIDVPSLSGITLEGPGDVTVAGAGAHPKLDLDLSGPGGLRWNGTADVMRCKMSGPGSAVLEGSANRMEADVTGPGTLNARNFPVTSGTFDLSGPGSVMVDLHGGDVSVDVSGPGSFVYTGDAHFTRRQASGPGSIHKRG